MASQSEEVNRPRKRNLDRVEAALKELLQLQTAIDQFIRIKSNYQWLLLEPALLFRYRKDCLAFGIALTIYRKLLNSGFDAGDTTKSVSRIKLYDKNFGLEVERVIPSLDAKSNVFKELLEASSKSDEGLVSYVSTHLGDLILKARSLQDRRLSRELIRLFAAISGREIGYLQRYIADLENWGGYSIKEDAPFFIRRVELFLMGGYENNQQFIGLFKDLGDEELKKDTLKNSPVRSLRLYYEQIKFLNLLIGLCRKSETSGEWEGFKGKRGFWTDFDKYVSLLRSRYGNDDLAGELEARKEKIGEYPEGWGGAWQGNQLVKNGFLQILLARLQHPTYRRRKIIMPAAEALSSLFKARVAGLVHKKSESISRLKKLERRLLGKDLEMRKVILNLRSVLARKRRLILRLLENDFAELKEKSVECAYDYQNLQNSFNEVLLKINPHRIVAMAKRLNGLAMSNGQYVDNRISAGGFSSDIRSLTRLMGADGAATEATSRVRTMLRYDHLTGEDFAKLDNLKNMSENLHSKLKILGNYVNQKARQNYELKIEQLPNLDITSVKLINKNFAFGIVKMAILSLTSDVAWLSLRMRLTLPRPNRARASRGGDNG